MANPQVLAHNHMAQQVQAATATQAALAVTFDRRLKPSALDDTFAAYLQGALALIAVGRDNAAATATAYYGAAKVNAGFEAIIPKLATPKLNVEKVATDLLVNGPVAIKKQLSSGVSMARAVETAKLRTLGVGKRHILDGARETVIGLSRKDSDALGWARVSDGAPCSFCGMLVSRGPVYKEGTAHFKSHNHCGCSARPYFRGEADGGWAPDALELRRLWVGDPDWHPGKVYPPGKAPRPIDPTEWRGLYNATLADVDAPLSKVLTEKVAGRISTQLATVARSTATEAIEAAKKVQPTPFEAMTDDELAVLLDRMLDEGDFDGFEKVGALLDERQEAARVAAAKPWTPDPIDCDHPETFKWFNEATDAEQDRFLAKVRDQDRFWMRHYEWETGKKARTVRLTEAQIREEYDRWLYAEIMRLQADPEIPRLLNPGSPLKDEADLWKVNDRTALANAPEELKLYWQRVGGRQTFGRFKAIMLDDGVRAVSEAMAKGVQNW